MGLFLRRYWDVVREEHSVIGILPGCYDGWLLDNEGVIPDPFTRKERLLTLGLRSATGMFVEYGYRAALDTERHHAFKESLWPIFGGAVDKVTKIAVKETMNLACGAGKCKTIMQDNWDQESAATEEGSKRRVKATLAQVWAGVVTAVSAVFFTTAVAYYESERAIDAVQGFLAEFAKDTFIIEPLVTFVKLGVSAILGRPIGSVSYKKRVLEKQA